jgi:hypothetical protein
LNANRIEIGQNQTDRQINLKAPASHFLNFLCQPVFGTFVKPHKPPHNSSFAKEPNFTNPCWRELLARVNEDKYLR